MKDVFLITINSDLGDFDSNYIQKKLSNNLRQEYNHSYLIKNKITCKSFNSLYDQLESIKKEIIKERPKIIIFSVNYLGLTNNFNLSLDFIKAIKKINKKIHINIEGIFATINYQEILKAHNSYIDSIIVGESEEKLKDLVEAIIKNKDTRLLKGVATFSAEKIKYIPRMSLVDIDALPFPNRSNNKKVLKNGGVIQVRTSRSCGAACNFCFLKEYYKINNSICRRERSPENVLREIKNLSKNSKIKEIWLQDEDFAGRTKQSIEKAKKIAKLIIVNKIKIKFVCQLSIKSVNEELLGLLKKANFKRIFIGVESSSQSFLNELNKGITVKEIEAALKLINKVGIFSEIGFIPFHKKATIESLKKDFNFLYDNCIQNNSKGYIQICNLSLLTEKNEKNKISKLKDEKIKEIYIRTQLLCLKNRALNNKAKEITINGSEARAKELIKNQNRLIIESVLNLLI